MASAKRNASERSLQQLHNLVVANTELIGKLAARIVENEKAQQKFRILVLRQLAKLETVAVMTHGAQIVETHGARPQAEEAMQQHIVDAEKLVGEKTEELMLEMLKFVYADESV